MSDFHYPSTRQKATKIYNCMACQNINESWNRADLNGMTFAEKRAYIKAKQNDFKIMPGEEYIRQSGVYDGTFYTFTGIPEMNDICHKYELYYED